MYHSSGNYEAFVHPRKPEGVENKSAYIVGTGLAGLSAAIFLVRDAQMPGENIHILEAPRRRRRAGRRVYRRARLLLPRRPRAGGPHGVSALCPPHQ